MCIILMHYIPEFYKIWKKYYRQEATRITQNQQKAFAEFRRKFEAENTQSLELL